MLETFIKEVRALNFTLPAFERVAWTTNEARLVWQPRIEAIKKARPLIFSQAAKEGLYPYSSGDEISDQLSRLPRCCKTFNERLLYDWKLSDPILAQALNTKEVKNNARIVNIKPSKLLNTIPGRINILPLDYAPCSMSCEVSLKFAEAWIETGRAIGFDAEMNHLEEILSWQMEWSALHGIAEIKLPILKISANTDATSNAYRVRVRSDKHPAESSRGISFPYLPPVLAKVTDSKGFKKGLANPISLPVLRDKNSHNENPLIENEIVENIGLKPKPRSSIILDDTLMRLHKCLPIPDLKIESVFLSNYFNIVRLNNGAVGACANYYRFKSPEAAERMTFKLLKQIESDSLLLNYLDEGVEPDLLQLSLKACLVSALSVDVLKSKHSFHVTSEFNPNFFPAVESAVVVGFGGYMDYLIHMTDIKHIHVSDFWCHLRKKSIQRRLTLYKERFPHRTITFSDGADNYERLARAELVCITGSALCSGTMDRLIENTGHCKTVIVQGQSAAILPDVLFEKGVSLISTSIKPMNMMEIAQLNPQQFKILLEGKLPLIYITPLNSTYSQQAKLNNRNANKCRTSA